MKSLSIVIGRFQPFHKQHLELVKEAAAVSDEVLICIGSANQPRTLKNPFTYEQRKVIITTTLINANIDVSNVTYLALEDKPTDKEWAAQVTDMVARYDFTSKFTLVGHHKDDSSYYLDIFKDFEYHEFEAQTEMSATFIRESWYAGHSSCNLSDGVDPSIAMLLVNNRNHQWYRDLLEEAAYIKREEKVFKDYPYPEALNICTADAIIVNNRGEICMIRRKGQPQRGLLALVGGHKESNETFLQCAVREASEEVGVTRGELSLTGVPIICDNPNRDPVLTKVSIAYLFVINEFEHLTAADDADKIEWIKWKDIPKYKSEIAFDHFTVLQQAFAQKTYATYL